MSLSDHLRYLRAMAGAPTTRQIAEAAGLEASMRIGKAETRYRPVEDPELVARLGVYYGRPEAEFHWHNARPRKYLTFYAARALQSGEPVSLTLRSGEVLQGQVTWWDLGSIGLKQADGHLLVVQRHAVVDWPDADQVGSYFPT
jgi:sRNA-binding regulator protein Hfq